MKKIPRRVLLGVLTMTFLISACGAMTTGSPTPVGTILANGTPLSPSATISVPTTSTGISTTPLIPITGENVVFMQCQFCVDNETHAVLIFPESAYFDVISSTPVTCLTADVVNGQRILICRGDQSTSFNLNICSDSSNCLQFPVTLQSCPLLSAGTPQVTVSPFAPFFLTPINTLTSPNQPDNAEGPSRTSTPGGVTITPPVSEPTSATTPPPIVTTEPSPQSTNTSPPPSQPTNTSPPPPTIAPATVEEPSELVICHISPGNPNNRRTMTVSESAWEEEHSRHGDSLGAC